MGLANEKFGSDDVTDEYIDLAAHITESALAKISVALAPKVKPQPIIAVAAVTFGDNVRQAITESLGVAKSLTSGVVIFGIQAAGIWLPLAALFGLPALAVVWFARKRDKRLTQTLSA